MNEQGADTRLATVLRMHLAGTDGRPRGAANVTCIEALPGKSHYLTGNDPRHWRRVAAQALEWADRARIVKIT